MSNFRVWMYSNYMADFVTSRWSAMEFGSLEECEKYALSSESHHPKRFEYYIQERHKGEWLTIGGLTRPAPDSPMGCCPKPLLSNDCAYPACEIFISRRAGEA